MSEPTDGDQAAAPTAPDPWKGLRGVMAGTLILEAITVLLALPVVGSVGGGVGWFSGSYLVILALVMILGADSSAARGRYRSTSASRCC